eukprot:scaffold2045_cov404-Prasinococcus_capsulatus_cf.AAC.58
MMPLRSRSSAASPPAASHSDTACVAASAGLEDAVPCVPTNCHNLAGPHLHFQGVLAQELARAAARSCNPVAVLKLRAQVVPPCLQLFKLSFLGCQLTHRESKCETPLSWDGRRLGEASSLGLPRACSLGAARTLLRSSSRVLRVS